MSIILFMVFIDLVVEILEFGNDVFKLERVEFSLPDMIIGLTVDLIDESLLWVIDHGSYLFDVSV